MTGDETETPDNKNVQNKNFPIKMSTCKTFGTEVPQIITVNDGRRTAEQNTGLQ